LIKGLYAYQSNVKSSEIIAKYGDYIRQILTGDRFIHDPQESSDSRSEDISSERGDLALTKNDPDDFKLSDIFDENGEIYTDTLWSSPDYGDVLVRNQHGCLLSVFDCYTVSIIQSEYGRLTVMSSRQPPHRGARPKDTLTVPRLRYACVACQSEDFLSAHSLHCHLVRIHDFGCDTLVNGRPFSHTGYIMRRANARERHDPPRRGGI